MQTLSICFLINLTTSFFFIKVNSVEKCFYHQAKKNTEIIIQTKIYDYTPSFKFGMFINIKEDTSEFHNVKRFLMRDKEKDAFLFYYPLNKVILICFTSKTKLSVEIKIRQHQKNEELNVDKHDFMEIESSIIEKTNSLKEFMTDFGLSKHTSENILKVNL